MNNSLITENRLDQWVRGNARIAQGVIVELVWRLVAASSPNPKERRFPLGDSIEQPGPDGYLNTDFSFEPFVPEGKSYWEIGSGVNAGDKASSDYRELTRAVPASERVESKFIFVTPLSGRRDWANTWKDDAQAAWLEKRRQKKEWKDVGIIDGTVLIDWLLHFPSVQLWLADKIDTVPIGKVHTPEQRWGELRTIGEPPPLIPEIFLVNRDVACEKLKEVFGGTTVQLKLDTRFPDQGANFVAAYLAAMQEDARIDALSRSLIISGIDGWNAVTTLREPHVLIADFYLDDSDSVTTRLLEKAYRKGHRVIFSGMPGGLPHPNRVPIPEAKTYPLEQALQKAGYTEERARTLAQRSNGNLNSLLRCLQHLSVMPEWAQATGAAELAVAQLLSGWNDNSSADRDIVEYVSGIPYGEWLRTMREIVLRPGIPLIQRNDSWKFTARYEGWYALGPKLFNEHLIRFRKVAIEVLSEQDPQFELPADERYLASIRGKNMAYSRSLRSGIAESLALLGSLPDALQSCSYGEAEKTAIIIVREVLFGANWIIWASLNDLLPLLAEAAPFAFLDAVEKALVSDPCPFDILFAQEGALLTGTTYISGLLWALETLAWDPEHFIRVVAILGELSARDPGGSWSNRPSNSVITILLPWYPQTLAPLEKRKIALEMLLRDFPEVAWKLLLALLPSVHQISLRSRKPIWREILPDDWSSGVSVKEYLQQVDIYSELAIQASAQDVNKLGELIERLGDLPESKREQLLDYLHTTHLETFDESERFELWTKLSALAKRHRRFAIADWAMKAETVDRIGDLTEQLAPSSPLQLHQRLFTASDFDLYEEEGDYKEQSARLEKQRQDAVNEVFLSGNIQAVLEFAKEVEAPWRVGAAFGAIETENAEEVILPSLLKDENNSLVQFVGGYIKTRFRKLGWSWIDSLEVSNWKKPLQAQFLAHLPFAHETWSRAAQHLGEDEGLYWRATNVNPYEAADGLEDAIAKLIAYERPIDALGCLERLYHEKRLPRSELTISVLQALLRSPTSIRKAGQYTICKIIRAMQEVPDTNLDQLTQIEWAFLPLLDGRHGAYPRTLERRLADAPFFFCDVIRTVFSPAKEEKHDEELDAQEKAIAMNAYQLLHRWSTPPGSRKDGTFSGDHLVQWIEQVDAICAESGHLEVAHSIVGQVLFYAPPDPDGLWVHHSVATILNSRHYNEIREGYQIALFNSRGVFWVDPQGREERELAQKYREKAENVEAHGYHRLAATLRVLADSYERQAKSRLHSDYTDD